MTARHHVLQIRTPEGILFSLQLASPIARFLAVAIDLTVINMLQIVLGSCLTMIGWLSMDVAYAFYIVGFFILSVGYGMLLEWAWRGQTLGKRVMRLRVVDERGLKLQPAQVVIRNLLRVVDELPYLYLVGGLACLFSRRAQRLGDFAANTIVIRQPRVEEPDVEQLTAGKYNSFRQHPHLEARLRQAVTPREADLAVQAILRRDELDPEARVDLFSQLADRFRALSPFPPEATDDLSDEQYLRNVVATIYRRPEL